MAIDGGNSRLAIARGKILAVMDADLQHPPEVAAKLCREMLRGADLGIASRHVEGGGVSDWALGRRIVSRGAQLVGFCLLPEVIGRISDPMSGFFMIRRTSIQERELSPAGLQNPDRGFGARQCEVDRGSSVYVPRTRRRGE